jgi:hypothetical protein
MDKNIDLIAQEYWSRVGLFTRTGKEQKTFVALKLKQLSISSFIDGYNTALLHVKKEALEDAS